MVIGCDGQQMIYGDGPNAPKQRTHTYSFAARQHVMMLALNRKHGVCVMRVCMYVWL